MTDFNWLNWQPEVWRKRQGEKEGAEPKVSYELRSSYDRDRSRLIHTPAFRRLQAKTQVLDIAEGDYHRTRLTHTMEVAQIARGLVLFLNDAYKDKPEVKYIPDNDLIEAISFAHDLGHPPFGHNGEVALNYMMREHGGFEGNGQSLRQVTKLESRIGGEREYKGISLSRRTLLGILKYPRTYEEALRKEAPPEVSRFSLVSQTEWKPPKCYYASEQPVVDWMLEPFSCSDRKHFRDWKEPPTANKHGKTQHKSLDCSLLELADDIAYATHDLEDGCALGFIRQDQWTQMLDPKSYDDPKYKHMAEKAPEGWSEWAADKGRQAPSFDELGKFLFKGGPWRRKAISHLIGAFIHSVKLKENTNFASPLLRFRAEHPENLAAFLELLKKLTYEKVIHNPEVQTLEFRGRIMIMEMFEAIATHPSALLKETQLRQYEAANSTDEKRRVICDYVAGMTDVYAARFYQRLFVPRSGSAFDKL